MKNEKTSFCLLFYLFVLILINYIPQEYFFFCPFCPFIENVYLCSELYMLFYNVFSINIYSH